MRYYSFNGPAAFSTDGNSLIIINTKSYMMNKYYDDRNIIVGLLFVDRPTSTSE